MPSCSTAATSPTPRPNEIAALGIAQVPGGAGVFGEPHRRARTSSSPAGPSGATATACARAIADVEALFPMLAAARDDAAADLSGGQQQMLALGMAFVARPGCC